MKTESRHRHPEYAQPPARLAKVGWLSQGQAHDRGAGADGPCYQWTRKAKAKTVSVALAREPYAALQQAIANWRAVRAILRRMPVRSRPVIVGTLPSPPRRKRLGKRVLGLI